MRILRFSESKARASIVIVPVFRSFRDDLKKPDYNYERFKLPSFIIFSCLKHNPTIEME